MKVSITPAGGTQFYLAGQIPTEGARNLKRNGKRLLDVVEFLKSEEVKVFNRKNRRNTFSFEVSRLHENEDAAELFIVEHEDLVPIKGVVTFEIGGSTGTSYTRVMLQGGVDSVDMVEHKGCTTIWSYTIVGGRITTPST